MERLLNKMDEHERAHPEEWCPISDEMLRQMYPDECQSQEGRDRKAETMPAEEFEMVFDAVLKKYRMRRKKKQQQKEVVAAKQSDQQTEQQQEIVIEEK
jgi:hypothetical protein